MSALKILKLFIRMFSMCILYFKKKCICFLDKQTNQNQNEHLVSYNSHEVLMCHGDENGLHYSYI